MLILERTPKAKAEIWVYTDIETRKYREQIRLDTLVVYTVNAEN